MKKLTYITQRILVFLYIIKYEIKVDNAYVNVSVVKWNPFAFILVLAIAICYSTVLFFINVKDVISDLYSD